MAKTTTKKKATKKTASSGKVVAGKKKFSLSRKEIIIFSVAAILAIGLGGFFGYQKYQENQSGAAGCYSSTFRQGSRGTCVKYIQQLHNYFKKYSGGTTLTVDGSFGSLTKSAIVSDQKKLGLVGDGIVGPKTWGILCYPQAGYVDSNGVAHPAWPDTGWRTTARAAGCPGA